MIFTKPTPPEDALAFANKMLVGSPMSSAEWQDAPPEIRARAFFSSEVESAQFLQRFRDFIQDFLAGNRDEAGALKIGSRAQFVNDAQEFLAANGIMRTDGGLTDITSEGRLGLIFNTQVQQAYGYGNYKQGMDPDVLNEFPAQRFIRVKDVKEPRTSHEQFEDQVYLKTDPIWARVINADFGVPWAPFGWGCGHDVDDVDRDEAESLGLIKPGERITPQTKYNFNSGLQASAKNLDPDLIAKLKHDLGDQLIVDGETLRWRGDAPANVDGDMSSAEEQSLRDYTDASYVLINARLRSASASDQIRNKADEISRALATLPDYDGTVYRRTDLSADELGKYIAGNVVTEDQFTSSSIEHSKAWGFSGNTFFTIESKTGKSVDAFSEHEHEEEILFDQMTQFKVLSRELINGVWQIKLEEL